MAIHKEATISLGLLEVWETLLQELSKIHYDDTTDAVDIYFDDSKEELFAKLVRYEKPIKAVDVFNQVTIG